MPKQESPQRLLSNYCSCAFQLKARQGQRGNTAKNSKRGASFPYAVCAKSVYQTRGKRAPGALACRFSKEALRSYTTDQLRGWLMYEGLASASKARSMSKRDAVENIHEYLQQSQPERDIRVARVAKRKSPVASVRRRGSPKAKRKPKK